MMTSTHPAQEVILTPYQPIWPDQFSHLKKRIGTATHISCIAHIGSTAVPGLVAKPMIDIQLGVQELSQIPGLESSLQSLGLQRVERATRDHIPFGSETETSPAWEKVLFSGKVDGISVNLHIRKKGNPNWRFALLVRDFLRATPEAALAYGQVKIRLAALPMALKDYAFIKDPVIDLLYLQAEAWATSTNWQQAL